MTTFNEQFGAMLIKAVREINRRASITKLRFGNCRYTAMKWTDVGDLLTEWKKDINHISVDIDVDEKLLWVKEDNKELFFADLYFLK